MFTKALRQLTKFQYCTTGLAGLTGFIFAGSFYNQSKKRDQYIADTIQEMTPTASQQDWAKVCRDFFIRPYLPDTLEKTPIQLLIGPTEYCHEARASSLLNKDPLAMFIFPELPPFRIDERSTVEQFGNYQLGISAHEVVHITKQHGLKATVFNSVMQTMDVLSATFTLKSLLILAIKPAAPRPVALAILPFLIINQLFSAEEVFDAQGRSHAKISVSPMTPSVTSSLISSCYERSREAEADTVSIDLVKKRFADQPERQQAIFGILAEDYRPGSYQPTLFGSHPSDASRAELFQNAHDAVVISPDGVTP